MKLKKHEFEVSRKCLLMVQTTILLFIYFYFSNACVYYTWECRSGVTVLFIQLFVKKTA